jgi:hypothetical protein
LPTQILMIQNRPIQTPTRLNRNPLSLNPMNPNRLNPIHLIPSLSTQSLTRILTNPTRNHLILTPMNRNRLNLTRLSPIQPIPSLPTQILTNLSRPILTRSNLIPMSWTWMSRSPMSRLRTLQARLRHSQCLPYKQTYKRKRGLRAPEQIVNDGTSLTPLLNRPALSPIVHSGKLARV